MNEDNITSQELEHCLKVLNALKEDPNNLPEGKADQLKTLVTKIYKQARKSRRKDSVDELRLKDKNAQMKSAIVDQAHRNTSSYQAEEIPKAGSTKLNKPRVCYSCHDTYDEMHFFYHRLCPDCAAVNYEKRFESADLKGRVAVVTGGRVKVGYATVLKLLRDGAKVIATTRFPHSAMSVLSKEEDFNLWKDHLLVYGLDLRYFEEIEKFIQFLFTHEQHIDILINNAAQTIKYPKEYYQPLIQQEQQALQLEKPDTGVIASSTLFIADKSKNPEIGLLKDVPLNRFDQPVDYRSKNSWVSLLDEIDTEELVEVNVINNIAPFILNSRLKPLLKASPFKERFIVNVTSSEGQFSYPNKKVHHPHTNMTKAALNMMTRTSADDYAEDQIYMSSVDVGWVSTGIPEEKRKEIFDKGGVPPLDPTDSAARIYHPILSGIQGQPLFGKLIKDYRESDW